MSAHYEIFDPLFPAAQAEAMVKLCEDFGSYGMYSEEGLNEGIGEGLAQRADAVRNFLMTGGRKAQEEPLQVLAARTNYFRETYGYGDEILAPGIEGFLHHEEFLECARRIHHRPVIEPAIVYANLLVPGQELATHTDVPEFRGANRKALPEWLLVVMHHSGLFDEWRMPSGSGSQPYGMAIDDQDLIWIVESGPSPNRFVGFDPQAEEFFSGVDIESGGGTVRHMYFFEPEREIWFGTDTNTIGRAKLP